MKVYLGDTCIGEGTTLTLAPDSLKPVASSPYVCGGTFTATVRIRPTSKRKFRKLMTTLTKTPRYRGPRKRSTQ